MQIILFENSLTADLAPLSLTRPVCDLRCGAFSLFERLQRLLPEATINLWTRPELEAVTRERHPRRAINKAPAETTLWLSVVVPWSRTLVEDIANQPDTVFTSGGQLVAANLSAAATADWLADGGPTGTELPIAANHGQLDCRQYRYLWDILQHLPQMLAEDVSYFPESDQKRFRSGVYFNKAEAPRIASPEIVQPGVFFNAASGPIIIAEQVNIGANTTITGPAYIGPHSIIKANSDIQQSACGAYCTLSGEIRRSVIQDYSNKAHYGYLGDSYLGSWVNLGAGTTTSNLKNNMNTVKISFNNQQVDSGRQFLGSLIGDYSRTAIGTCLNTGTVIGPGVSLVTDKISPAKVPSFSFYLDNRPHLYNLERFIIMLQAVMQRRNQRLSEAETALIKQLHAERSAESVTDR